MSIMENRTTSRSRFPWHLYFPPFALSYFVFYPVKKSFPYLISLPTFSFRSSVCPCPSVVPSSPFSVTFSLPCLSRCFPFVFPSFRFFLFSFSSLPLPFLFFAFPSYLPGTYEQDLFLPFEHIVSLCKHVKMLLCFTKESKEVYFFPERKNDISAQAED